jgi:gliding motility-associated lipoprotein GldH
MENKIIVFAVLLFGLLSCQNNIVWQQTKDIDPKGWHKDSIVSLSYSPNKTKINTYDIFFLIRNDNNYPYANLFLIAEIDNNKQKIIDTLEYAMADEKGNWLGSGIWDLKESKLVYKKNVNLDTAITIKLQQANRKTGEKNGDIILPGIKTVGIIIEKHQE